VLAVKSALLVTIRPEEDIATAVTLMADHNIGALLVVDESEHLVGILSERDVVRQAASDRHVFDLPVADVMTQKVIVALPSDDLMSVAHTMTEKRFRHLPIMQDGKLLGMISIGDVLKAQRDAFRGQIDTLETQILADDK
jgi:CBS domain-containing protein